MTQSCSQPSADKHYTVKTVGQLGQIGPELWAQCGGNANPFTDYSFLSALEDSGCVGPGTGWLPQYVTLHDQDHKIVGLTPVYVKSHSYGEYVFDHAWADAYHRANGRYYPKLQVSVPFTPVTGPRLLINSDNMNSHEQHLLRVALARGLRAVCKTMSTSSVHVTFPSREDMDALKDADFIHREDRQFHWKNPGYTSFDDFLADLNSRKRKEVRKERKIAVSNDITIHWLTGDNLTDDVWRAFFAFYTDTGMRKWGSPYLNLTFFQTLSERASKNILLCMARRNDHWIAGALNMVDHDTLYGRYWGCREYHPCLHFEVCYYQAIDYAIRHQLKCVEAGAQGSHKIARGYVPMPTYSAHWFANSGFHNAVRQYLDQERAAVARQSIVMDDHTPFKRDPNMQTDPGTAIKTIDAFFD